MLQTEITGNTLVNNEHCVDREVFCSLFCNTVWTERCSFHCSGTLSSAVFCVQHLTVIGELCLCLMLQTEITGNTLVNNEHCVDREVFCSLFCNTVWTERCSFHCSGTLSSAVFCVQHLTVIGELCSCLMLQTEITGSTLANNEHCVDREVFCSLFCNTVWTERCSFHCSGTLSSAVFCVQHLTVIGELCSCLMLQTEITGNTLANNEHCVDREVFCSLFCNTVWTERCSFHCSGTLPSAVFCVQHLTVIGELCSCLMLQTEITDITLANNEHCVDREVFCSLFWNTVICSLLCSALDCHWGTLLMSNVAD